MQTREQQRALHAYARIERVPAPERDDYSNAINDLGTTILRSGLAAAIANLERKGTRAVGRLFDDLAEANIHALGTVNGAQLGERVRALPLAGYMIATRDLLRLVVWFKRAAQAKF